MSLEVHSDGLKKIGSTLLKLRTRAGLSQKEAAERAGCTPVFISLVERAERNPTVEVLERIARAAGGELVVEVVPCRVSAPGVPRAIDLGDLSRDDRLFMVEMADLLRQISDQHDRTSLMMMAQNYAERTARK